MNQKNEYIVGESYTFRVKSVFGSYCELQDDNTVTYLQNTKNLRLEKGQMLECKVISNTGDHPKIELLNYGNIDRKDNMVNEEILTKIMTEMGITWSTRDFVKLVLTDDHDLSFDRHCHQWIHTLIEMQQDLNAIKADCKNILEMSKLLDSSSPSERDMYQERFTIIIELIGFYIVAKDLLQATSQEFEGDAQKFIDDLLRKLTTSGYIYHPRKAFNILSSLFVLEPALMHGNIERMFSIIKERDILQWKKEPFRSALLQVLEQYVTGNEKQIDNTKDNALIIYNTIQALSIQHLLHDDKAGDTDIVDYRINASRLCNLVSYANMANPIDIVNLALYNLLSSKIELPPYSLKLVGSDTFPFYVSNQASKLKEKIDTVSTFTHNNVRLTVSDKGIVLSSMASNLKAAIPKNLSLWNNLQVMLDSKPLSDSSVIKKGIAPYKALWTSIEHDLFESGKSKRQNIETKSVHKVHDVVRISIVRQDANNPYKFYCNIEDTTGGEGFIYLNDIVLYNLASPSVRHFISDNGNRLIFEAVIIDVEDGEYHFSMNEYITEEARNFYYDEEEIICFVSSNQDRNYGYLPGVTKEGISVEIKGLEDISGLKKGDLVTASLIGPSKKDFHIEAKAKYRVNQTFNMNESFHFLMNELAIDEVDSATVETEEDVETDRILDISYIRQLIYIIDRIATLDNNDNDYIKAYNYLGFARMLSLLIGWEEQATYYKGRMDIILMLHDFAINDKVNEESLAQLESMNADLFSSNVVLQSRFRQLQIVSYIGKIDHNADLWEASKDSDEAIRELASLVLSYNLMTSTNMTSQATDVHNRIKQTLRLNGYESGLKLYGTGIEDKTTEYKTSIVYLADKTVDIPNMQEQMKVILSVIDSFLNTDGGTLYIGVNDSGMGVGLQSDLAYFEFNGDKDKYARTITDAVVGAFGKVVATHVDVRFDPDNEKPVCIVKVTPYKDGIHYNGAWYVRIGSTKRMLDKTEFTQYKNSERIIPTTAPTEESQPETPEEKPLQKEKCKEPVVVEPQLESIPTSQIRFNVCEEYDEDFRPTIAYLQFLDNGKFRKTMDYNWDPSLLMLAVYDEDADGYLVMVYDNGYVAKVPMGEILKFDDRTTYSRYNEAKLVFASIAHAKDAMMTITEEDKGAKGRTMLRIDTLEGIGETKLADYGDRFYNEGLARRIIQVDIIPEEHTSIFDFVKDKDKRTLGFPVKTLSSDLKDGFAKLNISLMQS